MSEVEPALPAIAASPRTARQLVVGAGATLLVTACLVAVLVLGTNFAATGDGEAWLIGSLAGLGVLVAVILLLLAALRTERRYRVWWTVLGLVGAAAVAGLVWLFVRANDLVPAAADPTNATEQAARISAVTTLRGGSLAGAVGLAAIGTLIVNAVGARTATRNLELAREAQADARAQAQKTADGAARTLELTRTGQLTDRYVAAVELLTAVAPAEMSHLGGIYALERLAADAPGEYRATIVDVLAAYARTRAGLRGRETAGAEIYFDWRDDDGELTATRPPLPAHDAAVLAALTVLGRLATPPLEDTAGIAEPVLDDQDRREFVGQLQAGALWADLHGTNLRGIDLAGADLRGAQLQDSDLHEAVLRSADLRFADLRRCDLTRAQLQAAKLGGANFDEGWLRGARLDSATAGPGVIPSERTRFFGADLQGATFTGADLRGARLSTANGLTTDQLDGAFGNRYTTTPAHVTLLRSWPTS